jgi:LPS sulfotransferase NodH
MVDQKNNDKPTIWKILYQQWVPEPIRRMRRKFLDSRPIQELSAYLRVLAFWSKVPDTKFVIFTQGRTGGQLLVELLNSNPGIHCEHEILYWKVLFPELFAKGRSLLSKGDVYGFRVKIYQLTKKQGMKDPKKFMSSLHRHGWKIIYLKRANILRQALSYLFAIHRGSFQHSSSDVPVKLERMHVDSDRLIELLEEREMRLDSEKEVLRSLPHITIVYEDDLVRAENHQKTLDRLFDYLDVPHTPVKSKLVRTGADKLSDTIENFEEVSEILGKTKYAKFLYQ